MAVSLVTVPVRAEGEAEGEFGTGIIPNENDYDSPEPPNEKGYIRSSSLPSSYDGRNEGLVTSVKNQKQFGTCWAFSTNAALESSLIKSGYADNSLDLSELHSIYFMYNENIDPNNRIAKDRNYISADANNTPMTDFSQLVQIGGSLTASGWQMTNGVIPFTDNGDDYVSSAKNRNYSLPQSDCFNKDYRVKRMYRCNFTYDNIDNIKRLIYNYGGVAADFYCDQTVSVEHYTSKYFKIVDGTRTYYNPDAVDKYTNHGIEIVGWDDSYPKENFNFEPAGNGAWLVKNSWGVESNHDGYIWISYYNTCKSADAVAYELEPTYPNIHVYQYDGSDFSESLYPPAGETKDIYMLMFFTADAREDGGREYISKVGVGASANSEFTISIMNYEPKVVNGALIDYFEQCKTECKSTYDGYEEYKLSDTAEFVKGERYAVCVKVKPGSSIYMMHEHSPNVANKYGTKDYIEDGSIYLGYYLNRGLTNWNKGTPVIKAISETEAYADVTGISLDKEELQLDLAEGEDSSAELNATVTPSNANPEVTWTSSDPEVATVTYAGGKATVEGHKKGECIIKAISYNKDITASCKVTVINSSECEHVEEIIPAVEPSCTVEGLSEGKKCSKCGKILVPQQRTSPALGHKWKETKKEDATCKKEGRVIKKCSVCGEEQETIIPKKNHTPVIDPAVDPTETRTGFTAGKHCSVCGEVLIKQEVIPKLTPQKKEEAKTYRSEWVDGKWYDENGIQTYSGRLMWAGNATGWWVEDTDGWYPTSSWQKIDGVWYYFKADGYMACGEYCNGYWFNSDGSWDEQYFLSWKSNSSGWWVEDKSGWWPSNTWLKIDNYWYYFNSSGYMVTNTYIDGYWISSDGVCY